jgi:hypothetical protein
LLVALRKEADEVAGLYPGSRLEDIFNGRMLCYFDNAAVPSYSIFGTPVIIQRLATTRRAADDTVMSGEPLVRPALDPFQMDSFVERQISRVSVDGLPPTDVCA